MWFVLTQHFRLRGLQDHHDTDVEDFSFSKGRNYIEFITYEENPTKTRLGGLRKKDEWFSRKCLQLVDRDVQLSF